MISFFFSFLIAPAYRSEVVTQYYFGFQHFSTFSTTCPYLKCLHIVRSTTVNRAMLGNCQKGLQNDFWTDQICVFGNCVKPANQVGACRFEKAPFVVCSLH